MYTGMITHDRYIIQYLFDYNTNSIRYSITNTDTNSTASMVVDADTFMLALAALLIDDTCERIILSPAQKSAIKSIQPNDRTLFWVPASVYS